jgi:cell division protein FtsZ
LINLDFADVRTIMEAKGSALMGIGVASGDTRAVDAATAAISSPLLEASIQGADGLLISLAGGSDLGMLEANEAAEIVANAAAPDANIIFGTVIDDSLGDSIRVTVIATGFAGGGRKRKISSQDTMNISELIAGDDGDTGRIPKFEPLGGASSGSSSFSDSGDDIDIPDFLKKRY